MTVDSQTYEVPWSVVDGLAVMTDPEQPEYCALGVPFLRAVTAVFVYPPTHPTHQHTPTHTHP